ncbi:hypothetical protein ACFE04_018825 [Oxalis oulophora]
MPKRLKLKKLLSSGSHAPNSEESQVPGSFCPPPIQRVPRSSAPPHIQVPGSSVHTHIHVPGSSVPTRTQKLEGALREVSMLKSMMKKLVPIAEYEKALREALQEEEEDDSSDGSNEHYSN